MLDIDMALNILRSYGYSSTTAYPYIFLKDELIGICYAYIDEEFGLWERARFFDQPEDLESFLKQYKWFEENGKKNNVRIVLDNYDSLNAKLFYLRNEKMMLPGEMFDLESFDLRDKQKHTLDDCAHILYEVGELLLVYNEMKNRQMNYLIRVNGLKNTLRKKYFELQTEVDKYNKVKINRQLNLLPDVPANSSINEMLEQTIKDRYNQYKVAQTLSYDELVLFLREVWDLNSNLESNIAYYDAQADENDIYNELRVVENKIDLLKRISDQEKPVFGVDLVKSFKEINRECSETNSVMPIDYTQKKLDDINKKYSCYDSLDMFCLADYLKESLHNNDYNDLAIKYSKENRGNNAYNRKLPMNEIASKLTTQYKSSFSVDEQSVLVLYNSKFRKLFDLILDIENYEQLSIKNIIKILNKKQGFSKIKSECYDILKLRLNESVNMNIKKQVFANYDFSSFETFISSLIGDIQRLKNIDSKMLLNSDLKIYFYLDKKDILDNRHFILMTNDLNRLVSMTNNNENRIGLALLKKGLPVIYSPYYLDFGDLYSKDASHELHIKEMINFEMLVDINDVLIVKNDVPVSVARYMSDFSSIEDINVVQQMKMFSRNVFNKFTFYTKLNNSIVVENVDDNTVNSKVNNYGLGNVVEVDFSVSKDVKYVCIVKDNIIENLLDKSDGGK